jgi:DHA1 family bicyclomycin/chloramphenicol resistance-like MFS transporter
LRASLTSYRSLLSNRDFALPALVSGAAFGSLFTFLSSSPFVLGTGFGLSATDYGLAFGTVAAGLIGGMQLSPFLAARLGARMAQLAAAGLGSLGSIGLILAGEDSANLAVTLALLFVILATTGTLIPSSSSEAMVTGSQSMGAASGLVGALQFVIGGGVGLVGAHFGVGVGITPLAVTLLLCDGVALGLTLLRRDAASTLAASSPGGASTPAVLTTAGSNR